MVFELEEKLSRLGKEAKITTEKGKTEVTQVIRLLERKDKALSNYALELEEKSKKLEEAVEELHKKNEELSLWITSLKLYQEVFENDTSAMIGLNKLGRIVLFNKMASELFGDGLQELILHDISEVDFSNFDPAIPNLVKEIINTRDKKIHKITRDGTEIITIGIPLKSQTDFRGILLRITVSRATK